MAYNSQGRLHTLQTGPSESPRSQLNLTYICDAAGNVTQLVDSTMEGGSQTQTFAYDDLDRLTSASATGGTEGAYSRS